MNGEYPMRSAPGVRLQRRATHSSRAGTIALVVMAALPAILGVLQHVTFVSSAGTLAAGGQNAAAIAPVLGNQPSNSALDNSAKVTLGAKGEVLALCSGASGAKTAARPSCTTLSLTLSR